jgi:hypothetical protein
LALLGCAGNRSPRSPRVVGSSRVREDSPHEVSRTSRVFDRRTDSPVPTPRAVSLRAAEHSAGAGEASSSSRPLTTGEREGMPRPGCLPSSQVRGTTLRSHTPLPAYRHPNPLTPPCPAPAFGSGSTPGALPHEADIPRCLLPTPYTGPLLTTSRILQAAKHRAGGG